MKNIFTVILSTLIALTSFAAGITGRVSITFYGNNDYQVFIDGQSINSGNNRVFLNDVRPGRHTIEVYRLKKNNKRENRPVSRDEFTFRPQYDLNIIVDRNGATRINEIKTANDNRYDKDDRYDSDDRYDKKGKKKGYRNNNGKGRGRNDNDNGRWERNGNNNDRDRDYNDRRWDKDNNDNNYYNRAITDADFNRVIQKIRAQLFGKMNTAKSAVQDHYFTSGQVRQVLELFTLDGDRLELAKLAYGKVVDQGNYTQQVYQLLTSSSRNELETYISNYRSQKNGTSGYR